MYTHHHPIETIPINATNTQASLDRTIPALLDQLLFTDPRHLHGRNVVVKGKGNVRFTVRGNKGQAKLGRLVVVLGGVLDEQQGVDKENGKDHLQDLQ